MTKGERIKQLRRRKKLTLDELGRMVGLSRQTMSRYETGDIENIPEDRLRAIADILDTSPTFIMGWTDDPGPMKPVKNDGAELPPDDPRVSELAPDLKAIARAGTKLSPEQLTVIRKYAEFMYPEAFRDD